VSGIYYAEMVEVLIAAGVRCAVENVNVGWETRARSSGGFANPPLGITWHHTASSTTPLNDLNYMIHNSDDAPIGNLLLDRDGVVWPIAAGAANTQGKGGPLSFSRGTVPLDSGNSQLFGMEVANGGTGEVWPQVQIDAYFAASNALNQLFGNLPTDICSHMEWAPTRKIDPATAAAVQGPWVPGSVTSSGTWDGEDIRHECQRRSTPAIPPQPIPVPIPAGDIDMIRVDYGIPGTDDWWARMLIGGVGLTWVQGHANDGLDALVPAHIQVRDDQHMTDLMATFKCVGPYPSTWGGNTWLQQLWIESTEKKG